MSQIKLTDAEIAMLDTVIAMKKEEQGDPGGVVLNNTDIKFFRTQALKTVMEVAQKITQKITHVMDRQCRVTLKVRGRNIPTEDGILKAFAFEDGESFDTLTLDELIQLRKAIGKNEKS